MEKNVTSKKGSICLDCKNSGGLCSWSRNLEPVKGWDATFKKGTPGKGRPDSYRVRSCPLFESDEDGRIAAGALKRRSIFFEEYLRKK